MPMTSLSTQEEGRAFVEAADGGTMKIDATTNSATQHFYKQEPVLEQSMSLSEPIETLVFRAAQLHGTYFKCKDEDEKREGKQDPLAFAIQRKRERRKKLATKANKETGHLCLKWHSATKAQRAQHLIEVVSDPPANPLTLPPTPEKIEEADLLNTLDWLVAPVHHCLGCYNTKCKFRPWIHRAYNMSKEGEFTAQHKLPPKDTEDMEASAAGPDIQLAQPWESPKERPSRKGLEKILFQQSDEKTQSSGDTSWNSPPFDIDGGPPGPATATTDQLRSVEGAVATAEKTKMRGTQLNPSNW
eukprot:jgi/Psemu1/3080/gm1.3080_g